MVARLQRGIYVLSLLIFLQISGASAQDFNFQPLEPTGPFAVGTTSFHWVDETREETLTSEDPDDKRELMIDVWYPATVGEGMTPTLYLPQAEIYLNAFKTVLSNAGLGPRIMLRPQDFDVPLSHSYLNAPLSDQASNYPVLIFSPGAGGYPRIYTFQIEELASHGYIVIAINHPYGTAATVFPDGRVILHDPTVDPQSLIPTWSDDQIFVLDQLEALNRGEMSEMFINRLDLEKVGVFGMSLGGMAAGRTLWADNRFKAGVSEDGALPGTVTQNGIDQPFLYMAAEESVRHGASPSNMNPFRNFRNDAYLLIFDGLQHNSFSDGPAWGVRFPLSGTLDGKRIVELTNAYLVAFFDHALRGEDEPLLKGASPDYPEVDFQSNVS